MKFKCPECGWLETTVKDARPVKDNTAVKRRRQCDRCGLRFSTFEQVYFEFDGITQPLKRPADAEGVEL